MSECPTCQVPEARAICSECHNDLPAHYDEAKLRERLQQSQFIAETPYDVEALLREVREVVQPAPVLPDRWERRGGAWRCEGCGAWLTNKEGASGDHGRDDGHGNETQCGPVTFWSPAPAIPEYVRVVLERFADGQTGHWQRDRDLVRAWLAQQGSDG